MENKGLSNVHCNGIYFIFSSFFVKNVKSKVYCPKKCFVI